MEKGRYSSFILSDDSGNRPLGSRGLIQRRDANHQCQHSGMGKDIHHLHGAPGQHGLAPSLGPRVAEQAQQLSTLPRFLPKGSASASLHHGEIALVQMPLPRLK